MARPNYDDILREEWHRAKDLDLADLRLIINRLDEITTGLKEAKTRIRPLERRLDARLKALRSLLNYRILYGYYGGAPEISEMDLEESGFNEMDRILSLISDREVQSLSREEQAARREETEEAEDQPQVPGEDELPL